MTAWWRNLGWPVVVAGLALGGMLLGGVPVWRAMTIAAGTGAALWGVATTVNVSAIRWPLDRPPRPYRMTTIWQVPGLAAAQQSPEVFETHLRPQLSALASQLLARRGIDADSPAAVTALGPGVHAALFADGPTDGVVPALGHAIARLATDPDPPGPTPVPQPELRSLTGRRPTRIRRPRSAAKDR